MKRLFLPQAAPGLRALSGAPARYLGQVLRLAPGALLEVFDGEGGRFPAQIVSIAAGAVELRIDQRLPADAAALDLTLAQALAKGDKLELVIQKATELGVTRVTPLATARSVVKLDLDRGASKRDRWQRIAQEAARQCGRADVPVIDAPLGWDELFAKLSKEPERLGILLHPEAGLRLSQAVRGAPKLLLCVGPEGGFSPEERERAAAAGLVEAGLGPLVLRTETVALAALAVVQHLRGALG